MPNSNESDEVPSQEAEIRIRVTPLGRPEDIDKPTADAYAAISVTKDGAKSELSVPGNNTNQLIQATSEISKLLVLAAALIAVLWIGSAAGVPWYIESVIALLLVIAMIIVITEYKRTES
ncbi:hypothetical protein [Kitasatospora sp. LaBMicrA B282]|uniref:hypothetical protein n=1 Tax=Kitasatospora sp. LaBMicrA B282 TaxID=3420949 RepID=UPI003D111EF1